MPSGKKPQSKTPGILEILEHRFRENLHRHKGIEWTAVEKKIAGRKEILKSLESMEASGGEPDVISYGKGLIFCDCAPESPAGRRSLCYDRAARESRKEHKPKGSALELAEAMGIEILDEVLYRHLQTVEKIDQKTSSWIRTPDAVRKLGGALFCDRRYNQVFVYHNGAESYYAARGFRGMIGI